MAAVGDMLRLARQRLGLTQKLAAERLGIGQPILSRIENSISDPDNAMLFRAAQVYEVPPGFFDIPDPVYGPPVSVHVMTRGKADVTSRELDVISAELNIRLFHLRFFMEGVEFTPAADLPRLDIEQYGSAERIAATVRAHWKLPPGPIKNLMQLVERAGVIVGLSSFGGASVSGVTFNVPGNPPLVLLNEAHPADRRRFTLAHELGHLVMHRFPTATMEAEANNFASALLMPARDIRPAFAGRRVTLQLLGALKLEWRVAMQALLMRATSLELLKENQGRYLWQQISTKGWRLREPPELDFPPEEPRVLPSIIHTHLTALGYSVADLAQITRLRENEFRKMYRPSDENDPKKPRLRVVA